MAKYIKLKSGAASWPRICALCSCDDDLFLYEKDTEITTETNYVVVSKVVTRSYKNNYPICKAHYRKIKSSEMLLEILRVFLIGLVIISIIPIGAYVLLGQQGSYSVAAIFLIALVFYFRCLMVNKVPIRVCEIGDDFVILRFSSNKYAEMFLLENGGVCKVIRYFAF